MPDIPYDVYLERWSSANERARRRPLRPGSRLAPSAPTSFDFNKILGFDVVRPPESQIPRSPTTEARARLSLPSNFAFKLLGPLSRPGQSWCQVWLAELASDSPAEHAPAPKFAIKFFQESLFPAPEWVDYVIDNRPTAISLSHRECWAYRTLYDLHGTVLPHSYGFYDFRLPCRETVCAHVMEFIEGEPLSRDWRAMKRRSWRSAEQKEKRRQRMESFMICVHALHVRGVVHRDLSRNNVLLLKGPPQSFVIIDLGNAAAIYDPDFAPAGPGSIHDDSPGAQECLQEIAECSEVAQWLNECVMKEVAWMSLFKSVVGQIEELAESNEEAMREEAGLGRRKPRARVVTEPRAPVNGDVAPSE